MGKVAREVLLDSVAKVLDLPTYQNRPITNEEVAEILARVYVNLNSRKHYNPVKIIWRRILLKEISQLQKEYAKVPNN